MQQAGTCGRSFTFYLLDGFSLQAFSAAATVLRLANDVEGRPGFSRSVPRGRPISAVSALRLSAWRSTASSPGM